MTGSACRDCGAEIVWAETNHGKNIPLDPHAVVFSVVRERGKLIAVRPSGGIAGEQWLVSHFDTCAKKKIFSGSRRSEPAVPERVFSEAKGSD